MFGTVLRNGLRAWARAPIKVGFGSAITLGLLAVAYALIIQFSPNFWITLGLWGVVVNLALSGWGLFCVRHLGDENGVWSALFAGFRRPFALTTAGLIAIIFVLAPTHLAGYTIAIAGGADWLARLGVAVVACLTAPAGGFILLEAVSGVSPQRAVSHGLRQAYRRWPSLATLALLMFGLGAAGPMPGLLLERHALPQISALLPSEFAEYALAIVRLVALLGGVASVSAAGCIWAAAWRASSETSSPARKIGGHG